MVVRFTCREPGKGSHSRRSTRGRSTTDSTTDTHPIACDGIIALHAPEPADRAALIAGRDAEFHRWLGPGSPEPAPTACIWRTGPAGERRDLVGWIDADGSLPWLRPGEVNVGYNVFAAARGHGHGTRALQLLMHHLAQGPAARAAALLIDPANHASQALAVRAGFPRDGEVNGQLRFARPVPPLDYTVDGVRIRPPAASDLDADLDAKDALQQRWLWSADEIATWARMDDAARRSHAAGGLARRIADFGRGPKWTFSVDVPGRRGIGYIDCDLRHPRVPAGEANVAYAVHPDWRGRGVARGAVRALVRFLREHTGARQAHLLVEVANPASLRVASALVPALDRWTDPDRRSWSRHVIDVRAPRPGPTG